LKDMFINQAGLRGLFKALSIEHRALSIEL
jgi:hypothetical protein